MEWALQKSQVCVGGCAQLSSGFEGDSCFQRTPFSFDLLMLFMLVCWSWLIWKWHWPAWIKSLLLLLLRAAWPGWAVTGVSPVQGLCHVFSIQCARGWKSCKAPGRSLGDSCVPVNTAQINLSPQAALSPHELFYFVLVLSDF